MRYSVEDITRCTVAIHLYCPSLQQRAPTLTVVVHCQYNSCISVQVRVCTVSIFCLQGLCSLALSNAINDIRGIEPLSSKYRGIDTYCASYTNATGVLKNEKTNSCVYRLFPALFPATPFETDRAFFIFWNFLNLSFRVLIYNRDLL